MVFVTLRSGKVLQYNNGESIDNDSNVFIICNKAKTSLIARIPIEVVERVEFDRPCKIMREGRKDKLPIIREEDQN